MTEQPKSPSIKEISADMQKKLGKFLLSIVSIKLGETPEAKDVEAKPLAIINDLGDREEVAKLLKPFATEEIAKVMGILPLSGLWQALRDGKYPLLTTIITSELIYDSGFIKSMQACVGLKIAIEKKFERYIMSVILFGSLARGQATEESDVDIAVIVDDTDLKNMTRAEARKRLMAMINNTAREIYPKFSAIQVYLLTDVWDWIKDASPVIFTLIRDGVPLYDKGLFMPWRLLLETGKIKPSPEAINNFQQGGRLLLKLMANDLNEIASEKIFQAMLMPTQAALMLFGLMPMTYSEAPKLLRKVFVEEEKLLEDKFPRWLEEIVDLRKQIEHGTVKQVSGIEIDKHLKRAEEFNQRMEQLYEQIKEEKINKRLNEIEKTLEQELRVVLKGIGITSTKNAIIDFKKNFSEKDKLSKDQREFLFNFERIKKAKDEGKLLTDDVNRLEKEMLEFLSSLEKLSS